MTPLLSKIKIFIVLLIILSLSWASFNLFYFVHFHIDESGQIFVHAHPYQKANEQRSGAPTHSHSKSEFTLLAIIYEALSIIIFSLIFIIFTLKFNPNLKPYILFHSNFIHYFFKNIFKRGPPLLLQSI